MRAQGPVKLSTSTRILPGRFKVAFSLAGEQRKLVRAIAQEVEKELGRSNVFFDEWFEHYIAGSDADIKLQEIYAEKCELAVVCVSGNYGDKPWTLAEHEAIRSRVMQARATVEEADDLAVLPIRVGDGNVRGIPFNAIVPDVRNRTTAEAARLIIDRLALVLAMPADVAVVGVDWPEQPPALNWPIADHSEVREAFECLLTRAAPWRFLPVSGPSESGKSYITRQMLINSFRLPDIACGRFDFKGTTGMDGEVGAFVDQLEVSLPPPSDRLNERLSHVLNSLKQRARPTLLIFDTYEAAGEAEQWMERQLMTALIRATWLRVVVAGQRVPRSIEPDGCPILELTTPPPADWFAYGQQYRTDLTLTDVETACRLANGKATLLAQLLGPTS